MTKYSKQDGKRAAKIETDDDMINLLVCNNGWQWSGATMYSREVAEMAYEVLGKYLENTHES